MARAGKLHRGISLALALGVGAPAAWAQAPATAPAAAPAPAPKNQYLLEAIKRARAGQYRKCLEYLDGAARFPGNPKDVLRDIQGMRAICLRLVDPPKPAASDAALDRALGIDPGWRPPDWVPGAVARALAAHMKAKTVRVIHTPVARAAGNRPVVISARVVDPEHRVAQLYVAWRLDPDRPYTEQPLHPAIGGELEAYLTVPDPGTNPVGYELDYYVAAADAEGTVLDSSGTPENPHRLQVVPASRLAAVDIPPPPPKPKAPPPPPRWYQHWWVWTLAGVVVVGAGAGAFAATRPVPTPEGTLGSVQLPERRP